MLSAPHIFCLIAAEAINMLFGGGFSCWKADQSRLKAIKSGRTQIPGKIGGEREDREDFP